MTGSRSFSRVNDHPHGGCHEFYRQRRGKAGARRTPVFAGETGCLEPGLKNPIHWQNCAYFLAGLLLALMLTGCGQTNGTSSPQPGQTAAQAEFKGKHLPKENQPQGGRFPYAPGEVLVKFNPEVEAQTIAEIRTELKLQTIQKFSSPNLFLMKITDSTSIETMIKPS